MWCMNKTSIRVKTITTRTTKVKKSTLADFLILASKYSPFLKTIVSLTSTANLSSQSYFIASPPFALLMHSQIQKKTLHLGATDLTAASSHRFSLSTERMILAKPQTVLMRL